MVLVSSIPEPSDVFVGREVELGALEAALDRGHRLVAIVGTAGVGKTRLAVELARRRERSDRFDAVLVCDLVEARSALDVGAEVARLLAVPLASGDEAEAVGTVGRAIAGRGRVLLVLDNFEHLPPSAAGVLTTWLDRAPGAKLVVTSRVPLGCEEEHAVVLEPLPVAGPGRSDAARLFVARASAARATIAEDEQLWSVAEAIAVRLDGIPLAIELAAARLELLGAKQVLARLEQGLVFLRSRRTDRATRHQAMEAAIAWSWDLLDAPAKDALARCAVFRGSFSMEAAEAVLRPPPGGTVLDLVEELVDRSLLRAHEAPGLPEEPRFSLYAVIRDFAAHKLDEDSRRDAVDARDRHYLEAARTWARPALGADGRERLRRLTLEQGNLVAIVQDAVAAGPSTETAERALAALACLAPVMLRRSCTVLARLFDEARDLVDRSGLPADSATVLRARLTRAKALRVTGRHKLASTEGEAVLAEAVRRGDPGLEVETILHLGECLLHQTRYGAAAETLAVGIERCERLGLAEVEAPLRATRGFALVNVFRFGEALEELMRARDLATLLGDEITLGAVLRSLGHLHSERGTLTSARSFLELAIDLSRALGDRSLEASAVSGLAFVQAQEGDLVGAAAAYDRAHTIQVEVGNLRGAAAMLAYRGLMLHWLGEMAAARSLMQRSLEAFTSLGDDIFRRHVLGRLGALLADAGDVEGARDLFVRARALAAKVDDPQGLVLLALDEAHVPLALCRAAVTKGDFTAAFPLRREVERAIRAASTADGSLEAPVARSDDARLAVGRLRQALELLTLPASGLVVRDDFAAFQAPSGAVGELSRKPLLRRLLEELVRMRLEHPGETASWRQLVDAGWEGRRAVPKVAKNRLYVAITALRDAGLRGIIQARDDGWLLDPELALFVVREEELRASGAGAAQPPQGVASSHAATEGKSPFENS